MSVSQSPQRTPFTIQTSTPLHGCTPTAEFVVPDASTVGGLSTSSVSQGGAFQIFRSRSSVSEDLSFSDEDEGVSIGARRKVNVKSKDYLCFHAKRGDGLYKKLIDDPECTATVASEILMLLEMNAHAAFQSLLEFFLDLAGFQHIDLKKIYPVIDVNFETIIAIVEDSLTEEHKRCKYLLRAKTHWARQVIKIASVFLRDLVFHDSNNKIFHINKPNNILRFISIMCNSKMRALCHTGTFIAIKMNSAYCKVESHSNNSSLHMTTISDTQKYLWNIVKRVSHITDRCFDEIRAQCVEEMWIWFRVRPECFLNSEANVKSFLRILDDISPKVRLSALDTCQKLITSYTQLIPYLRPYQNHIVSAVVRRIDDANMDVTAKAVDVCTNILDLELCNKVPADRIMCLTIANYYPLAAACGRFFIGYTRRSHNPTTQYYILHSLLQLCKTIPVQYPNAVALIVEATLDCTPELQNWPAFINSLMHTKLTTDDRAILYEIFCQAILQTVTGRCEIERNKGRKGVVKRTVNGTIVRTVLPHFANLIDNYVTEKRGQIVSMKMLDVMDFTFLEMNHDNEMSMRKICNSLLGIYKHSNDVELTVCSVKALKALCNNANAFKGIAQDYYVILQDWTVDQFKKIISELPTGKEKTPVTNAWLCVAAAMETTEVHKKFKWNDIFTHTYKCDVACLQYQLTACKWFLYKNTQIYLETSATNENNNVTLHELTQQIQQLFKYESVLLFSSKSDVSLEAFKQIVDMQMIMVELLMEVIETDANLSVLLVEISDERIVEKFCEILQISFIESKTSFDLETRKMYVHKVLSLFLKEKHFRYFPKIFVFYAKYYEEFSDVFDSVVFYIKANAPISFILLIFDTLFLAFSNTTFNSEDLLHSMKNATDLKNLVKQMIRSFVKTAQDALPIVRLSFRYILKNLNHLHFFFVLSYFVEKLGLDDCTVLYDNLKTEIPREHHNHPGFLNFMCTLKNRTTKTAKPRGRPKKKVESTSSASNTDYTIHDASDSI